MNKQKNQHHRKGFTLIGLPFFSEEKKRSYKGFTLIELMVAISIVAILATIGFSTYSQTQVRARDAKRKQDLRALSTALELYYQSYKHYPCTDNHVNSGGGGTWIVNNFAYAAGCGDATHVFDTRFINQQPLDPNHPTRALVYFGRGDNYATCTMAAGQGYVLIANLENSNDPDVHSKKAYKICGTTPIGWNPNDFIITSE